MSRTLPAGFGSLWTAVAVDLIGFGIVIPILPLYAERFDASPAVIGLLLASFSLAQFAAAPFWGRISDRHGRKPALIASLAGTALGSLLTATAPSIVILFIGRILDGASGGSMTVAQAAAADLAPPSQRPRLLGLLGAAFGIGFVAGPAIGGLASLGGPRTPFFLAAGLAAANAAVAARRLPETSRQRTPRHRGGMHRERSGPLVSALVVSFLSTAAFGAFEATFALLGSRRLDLSASGTSLVFVAAGLLIALVNARGVDPAVRRVGEVGALRLGLALDAAGLALLATVNSLPALAVAIPVLAAGHGLIVPTLASVVTARVAPESRGAALGSQQSAASLARVAGPALAGSIFSLAGPTGAFVGAAALALAATTVTGRLRGRPNVAAATPTAELVA